MTSPDTASRFRGALLGVMIGDILGSPFEGRSRDQVRRVLGDRMGFHTATETLRRIRSYTDDTAQTLCIARSIASRRRVDPADIMARLVDWYKADARGIGFQTIRVLQAASRGANWRDAARMVWEASGRQAAGNGSLMRFAPVAIVNAFASRARLEEESLGVSRLTHWDDRCSYSAYGIGLLTRRLPSDPPDKAVEMVIADLRSKCPGVAEAMASAVAAGGADDKVKSGGYVLETVQAATHCILRAGSFAESVGHAVSLGEDTDTTAAVVGGIAGFRFGLEGIPKEWRAAVNRIPEVAELERLTATLCSMAEERREKSG